MTVTFSSRPLVLLFLSTLGMVLLTGCTVDKDNPKYDERRYTELQKARCGEIATVLSKPLMSKETEDYDTSLKRCQDLKSLSYDEYMRLADYAREHGSWDIYTLYPEKKAQPTDNPLK